MLSKQQQLASLIILFYLIASCRAGWKRSGQQASCHRSSSKQGNQSGQWDLIESTESGKRFVLSQLEGAEQNELSSKGVDQVKIDLNIEKQPILGWGGSFTDSALINMAQLPKELSDKLLESYFGEKGLQYNFGRVPIGGSDFSTRAYTYDNHTNDFDLTHWKLAEEDITLKIPSIKRAMELVEKTGEKLKLIASPWSPPEWMKTSKSLVRGHLIDEDKVYSSYAEYLMKFYDAYGQEGIEFWGATVQNEPIASYLPFYFFNSLQMSSSEAIKFIGGYLGPALAKRGMTKENFKLIVGDDSLGFVDRQAIPVLRDPKVQKYVSGLAFHWYTSGSFIPYDDLNRIYNQIKEKIEFMIMTEACTGSVPGSKHVILGSWSRGEDYASDIIEDLNRHTNAWIDWNLALNLEGGPNWSKNFVDSPILVDEKKGAFYKQPMYYALAHFSRLFRPGSKLVQTEVGKKYDLLATAAVHKADTGHVIVNLLNKSKSARTVELKVKMKTGVVSKQVSIEAKSINSVVLKL